MAMTNSQDIAKALNQAAKAADHDDLFDFLDRMVRSYGRIELIANSAGEIDVRCGGISSYSRRLHDSVRARMQLEADRVTNKLMGGVADERAGQSALGAGYARKP